MKFSYSWLQSYFKDKLPPPSQLAGFLSDHFANVEEVKKHGKDFLLDIEVRPNRAGDCFGHWGVAREMAAILKLPLSLPQVRLKEDEKTRADRLVRVEVKDRKACPRYTARVISGVKVGPSPRWLRERLETCGLQSINNVVDIANYVMLETNQPLHAFDWDKISTEEGRKTIVVRLSGSGEKLLALDDKTYELGQGVLVIANNEEPLGIAGIKGGRRSGVEKSTRTVVLEGANFNHLIIRRASQKLNLKTDASWRFEHGLDPNLTETALARAAGLIQEIAGGRIFKGAVDFYPVKRKPLRIKLEESLIEDLLGIKIPPSRVRGILTSLGFGVRAEKGCFSVEVPTVRTDVLIPENLVEEIGRIYGYQKIPAKLPQVILSLPTENRDIFWEEKSRDLWKEAGFSEVWNYSFLRKDDAQTFGFKTEQLVELKNPLDQSRPYLVGSLLPNLFLNIASNSKNFDAVRIFELGKAFLRNPDSSPTEERRIAAVAWGRSQAGWTDLKEGLDFFFKEVGVTPTYEKGRGESVFDSQGFFRVRVGRKIVGRLGQVKEEIATGFKISSPLYALEMNFEKLSSDFSDQKVYRPLSKHPEAKRDLTLLVSEKTGAEDVVSLIQSLKITLLKKLELVNVYQGEELPTQKKSLSFRLTFQSAEKTLSAQEVEDVLNKIIEKCQSRDWLIRQ
ncbi:MAG: phenylalanine--tRNA ligase subunit beta [Candidatus Nealsonbacteria bacterium]|nr:phenylalanine--tRNA ligase subunit beta [Candidatus Nealsonbacteria bacterium]